jgi:DNA replication protein DnaC
MNPNWINAIKMMKIQNLYHDASLENCPLLPLQIVELGKKWIKATNRPNLYIHGNTGSGKTYFATCLFRAMVEKNLNWLIFVRSDDLDQELLDGIEQKRERSIMEKYYEVPVLFIDDLGVERPTDRMIRQYYTIIDKRIGVGLLTVITSNLPREQLLLGDRTLSRLEHFYNIEFPKKDIRKIIQIPSFFSPNNKEIP